MVWLQDNSPALAEWLQERHRCACRNISSAAIVQMVAVTFNKSGDDF